eukprot:PhM_4_TR6145/c0_g1_i1/m.1645
MSVSTIGGNLAYSKARAILFDAGGVLVRSPMEGVEVLMQSLGLPPSYLTTLLGSHPRFMNTWAMLEAGHIDVTEFKRLFDADLRGAMKADSRVTASSVIHAITDHSSTLIPETYDFLCRVKESEKSVLTGLVTNNYKGAFGTEAMDKLREKCDVVVESYEVRSRKPDPTIYMIAIEQIYCRAYANANESGDFPSREEFYRECVFVDDFAHNLVVPRENLGMRTVLFNPKSPAASLRELAHVSGLFI